MRKYFRKLWANCLVALMLPIILMMGIRHAMAGDATALGDTDKTSLGSITLPTTAKRVIGVWCHGMGGPGNTTLENLTGIFELESESLNLAPMQFPLDIVAITGTGMVHFTPKVWPVDWTGVANAKITCYATLDLAQTLANTGRWGLIYE